MKIQFLKQQFTKLSYQRWKKLEIMFSPLEWSYFATYLTYNSAYIFLKKFPPTLIRSLYLIPLPKGQTNLDYLDDSFYAAAKLRMLSRLLKHLNELFTYFLEPSTVLFNTSPGTRGKSQQWHFSNFLFGSGFHFSIWFGSESGIRSNFYHDKIVTFVSTKVILIHT